MHLDFSSFSTPAIIGGGGCKIDKKYGRCNTSLFFCTVGYCVSRAEGRTIWYCFHLAATSKVIQRIMTFEKPLYHLSMEKRISYTPRSYNCSNWRFRSLVACHMD